MKDLNDLTTYRPRTQREKNKNLIEFLIILDRKFQDFFYGDFEFFKILFGHKILKN